MPPFRTKSPLSVVAAAAAARTERNRAPLGRAATGFLLAAALLLTGVAAAAKLIAPSNAPLAVLGAPVIFALAVAVATVFMRSGYPHERIGLCNLVTLSRAALAAILTVPLLTPGVLVADPRLAWTVVAIAALALTLDGVDGWLARRSHLTSAFGARFDMEIDSILALILAALALQSGKAGVWVLALGLMRYAFAAATLVRPKLRAELPPRLGRKVVCVLQIGVLVALLAPVVTPPVSIVLAGLATLALVWSFAVDVLWLERRCS